MINKSGDKSPHSKSRLHPCTPFDNE